ncbi:MAG: hypothetical protein LBB45_08600 [Methanobrevibacter sp.]|jgi:hypothetical protein|nr:hypothetical protein [Candidatus Methanovirga basalitermitum]
MNKKILAKTLLPIATVALLGGGIASSLVACSKKQKVELVNYQLFNSKQDIYDYINKNAHHPAAPDLSYNTLDDYSFVVNSTSLVVGVTKVQKINFPYSFITIGNNYTVNFGTTDDLISLVFTGDSISLKHESTSLVFYQDGA